MAGLSVDCMEGGEVECGGHKEGAEDDGEQNKWKSGKVEIRRWNKWTTGRVEKSFSEELNKNARQLQISAGDDDSDSHASSACRALR